MAVDTAALPLPRPATLGFMLAHPAHMVALGFGCGLSRLAPGTVGTLWAWVAFLLLDPLLSDLQWGLVIGIGTLLGGWAGTVTARHLGNADPASIVVDEVLAFWCVLWLVMPASFAGQLAAFTLFRFYDAVKPGPIGWADRYFKPGRSGAFGWRQGAGILFDDAVAALCTLLTLALAQRLWPW